MSEDLMRAVKGLVAARAIFVKLGIPDSLITYFEVPFYGAVLDEIMKLEGMESFSQDDFFAWLLDYFYIILKDEKYGSIEGGMVLLKNAMLNLLNTGGFKDTETLREKIMVLTSEDGEQDWSIWENNLPDTLM